MMSKTAPIARPKPVEFDELKHRQKVPKPIEQIPKPKVCSLNSIQK